MNEIINHFGRKLGIDFRYIYKAGFWIFLSAVIAIVVNLVSSIAFANLLEPSSYGTYKYVLSIIELTSALSLTGIGTMMIKSIALGYDQNLITGTKKYLKRSTLSIAVTTTIAIYYLLNDNFVLAISIFIAGILAPLFRSALLYNSYLQAKKDFKNITIFQIINSLIPASCMIATLFFTNNVILIVSAYFISNVIVYGSIYGFIVKYFSLNKKSKDDGFRFANHLSFINLFSNLATQLDKLITFQLLGAANLAIYTIAYALPMQFGIIRKGIRTMILPKMSSRSLSEIRRNVAFRSFLLFLLGLSAMIIYILIAPKLISTLFPKYVEGIYYSQLLSATMLFICVVPYNITLVTHEFTKALYFIKISTIILYIPLIAILTITYGIYGVIISLLIKSTYELVSQVIAVHFYEPN